MKSGPAALVFVLAGLMVPAARDQWRPAPIVVPEGVLPSALTACMTDAGAPAIRMVAQGAGALDALCDGTVIARCSMPGAEPVDLPLPALCRGTPVAVHATVRFLNLGWGQTSGQPIVEWREWIDSVSAVLATRRIDSLTTPTLPLAADARLIRVYRAGSAPVTLDIPAAGVTPEDVADTLPPPEPGGELFLRLGAAERAEGTLTVRGPETRILGVNGAEFLSVPGLPPGDYTIRFGTEDMPIGLPLDFRIASEATTEVVPRLPTLDNFRISGVVTLNGGPLARQALEVINRDTDDEWSSTTDDRGRYSLTVPEAGFYIVRVVADQDFGQLEAGRDVARGETVVDIALVGANVRLAFTVDGVAPEQAVEFVLEGPQRFSGVASDFSQPTELFAIPPGTYAVSASLAPDYVSRVETITIDETTGVSSLAMSLQRQTATLRALGDGAEMVAGTRARAGGQLLRTFPDGRIDVSRVAPGSAVVVRAPGRVPDCVVLQPNQENLVALGSVVASLQVRFEFEALRTPPGRIRLGPAGSCTIPLEDFEWRVVAGGFEIANLPSGLEVTYEYATRTFAIRAPGEPVVIR